MSERRVSDEQLRSLQHPHERAIAPVWGNVRVSVDDIVDDLVDSRAENARLRELLRECQNLVLGDETRTKAAEAWLAAVAAELEDR